MELKCLKKALNHLFEDDDDLRISMSFNFHDIQYCTVIPFCNKKKKEGKYM